MAAVIQWILLASTISAIALGSTVIIRQQDGPLCPEGERCLSFSECLANSDTCFTSNKTLLFDQGDHFTDGIEMFVLVEGVTNLTLTSDAKDSASLVRIKCTTQVAIAFVNIINLAIQGITFTHCGREVPSTLLWEANTTYTNSYMKLFDGTQAALLLVQTENFNALNVEVSHSYGLGLLGWNVLGHSKIIHSIFSYNNYNSLRQNQWNPWYCRADAIAINASRCIGGNAAFLFQDMPSCLTLFEPSYTLTIAHSEFKHGVNLDYENWSYPANYFYPAGGLSVFVGQSTYHLNVYIYNASIHSNIGYAGANMVVYIHDFSTRRSSRVVIGSSYIMNGNSDLEFFSVQAFSGGLYFGYGYPIASTYPVCPEDLSHGCKYGRRVLTLTITDCVFDNNLAFYGAAMYALSVIDEDKCLRAELNVRDTVFRSNTGISAIVHIEETHYEKLDRYVLNVLFLRSTFEQNVIIYKSNVKNLKGEFRAALALRSLSNGNEPQVSLIDSVIQENTATGLHLTETVIALLGNVTIQKNNGVHGGGISLSSNSRFSLGKPCEWGYDLPTRWIACLLTLKQNTAVYGGGIFYNDDCLDCRRITCFYKFRLKIYSANDIQVRMMENSASVAGNSVYGGNLDKCYLDICTNVNTNGSKFFHHLFRYPENASLTEISSDPQQVCFCELQKPVCGLMVKSVSVYPGALFSVDAVGVGQMNGTVPTVVVAEVREGYSGVLQTQQDAQPLGTVCDKLSYRVTTNMNYTELELDINFERKRQESLARTVAVAFKGCPLGFRVNPDVEQCDCIEFLSKKGVSCDIDTLELQWQSPLWVGYSHNKFMAHDNCPFDYCKEGTISASFPDTSAQCEFSRSGILCGQCQSGLSSVFATSHCKKCSNKYLSLLIPIALAGFLLVALLIYCDLTVAKGTLNSLIFYANIVRVNHNIIFPAGESNLLTVFIAWLNLDLGIETCFYDGMDEYGRTWLQFVFPVYVWVIVGIIIVACWYSSLAVRITGSNAVAVLATLFLLSYTKIQRTVLTALSLTVIPSHDGGSSVVWLFDGNVLYVNGKHAALFLMAIFVVVAFILPFTLTVLFGPLLQSKFSYRLMKLKLTPILDAYQAPYKDKFRCWTGVMLVIRSILLFIFSVNALGSPRLNLLLVVTLMVLLLGFIYGVGTAYRLQSTNVIDSFYIVNLILLSAWTEFNRQGGSNFSRNQAVTSSVLVGAAFIVFVGIVFYHAGQQVKKFMDYHDIHFRKLFRNTPDTEPQFQDHALHEVNINAPDPMVNPRVPTVTYVDIRARESLLGSYNSE